ncbi:MAG: nitroreductase family protein [Clostridium sp.]|nr:nitroreductase family protein [Clostridium sp.]
MIGKERMDHMEFMELAKKRFSVRNYSDTPVEKKKLVEILEAAMIAPTAKNLQPQRVYVLQSKEALAKLDRLTHCRYGAQTVLLFTYNEKEEWRNPLEDGIHSGVEDVSIAATHVMLRAAELGIDTTWCNLFENSKLEEEFQLPENEKAVLIMPVGYRAADVVPAPMHAQTKDLDTIVKYL